MGETAQAVAEAKPVTLTIDGKKVEASVGATVLEAAQAVGIDIPTMCHHEELAGYGACRLCIVELVRGKRSRIVVSCLYPVEEGLEVLTESPKVVHHRKIILELMLARWPWVDQELLDRYGVTGTRFEENTTFCILCGLCVRYCNEVKKQSVLGFIGRGTTRQVVLYPELAAKACPECGGGEMECLKVCPTGCIANEYAAMVAGTGGKLPVALPIRLMDADNARSVSDAVGDREKK